MRLSGSNWSARQEPKFAHIKPKARLSPLATRDLPAAAIVRRDFDLSLHSNLSHPENENTPHPGLVLAKT